MQVRRCVECGEYRYIEEDGRCRHCYVPSFDVNSVTVESAAGRCSLRVPDKSSVETIVEELDVPTHRQNQAAWTVELPSNNSSVVTIEDNGDVRIRSQGTEQTVQNEHKELEAALQETSVDAFSALDIYSVTATADALGSPPLDRVYDLLSLSEGDVEQQGDVVRYKFDGHSAVVEVDDSGTAEVHVGDRATAVLAVDAFNDVLAYGAERE